MKTRVFAIVTSGLLISLCNAGDFQFGIIEDLVPIYYDRSADGYLCPSNIFLNDQLNSISLSNPPNVILVYAPNFYPLARPGGFFVPRSKAESISPNFKLLYNRTIPPITHHLDFDTDPPEATERTSLFPDFKRSTGLLPKPKIWFDYDISERNYMFMDDSILPAFQNRLIYTTRSIPWW